MRNILDVGAVAGHLPRAAEAMKHFKREAMLMLALAVVLIVLAVLAALVLPQIL